MRRKAPLSSICFTLKLHLLPCALLNARLARRPLFCSACGTSRPLILRPRGVRERNYFRFLEGRALAPGVYRLAKIYVRG